MLKNPSDRELSEDADLQETYNKLCKIAAKDAMNVELGLKKIESLELDKKNLLVKLFDANELLKNLLGSRLLCYLRPRTCFLELRVIPCGLFHISTPSLLSDMCFSMLSCQVHLSISSLVPSFFERSS